MNNIHVIARAIIIDDGHLLVTLPLPSANYTYLPGGHVEFGEPAAIALLRELEEELGVTDAEVIRYAGTTESAFTRNNGKVQHEVCSLFIVSCPSLSHKQTPVSCEAHIGFKWVPLADLASANILPTATIDFVHQLATSAHALFFSTFGE